MNCAASPLVWWKNTLWKQNRPNSFLNCRNNVFVVVVCRRWAGAACSSVCEYKGGGAAVWCSGAEVRSKSMTGEELEDLWISETSSVSRINNQPAGGALRRVYISWWSCRREHWLDWNDSSGKRTPARWICDSSSTGLAKGQKVNKPKNIKRLDSLKIAV